MLYCCCVLANYGRNVDNAMFENCLIYSLCCPLCHFDTSWAVHCADAFIAMWLGNHVIIRI